MISYFSNVQDDHKTYGNVAKPIPTYRDLEN